MDQINKAWTIADPRPLEGLGLTGCKSCKAYVDTAKSMKAAGQRYRENPGKRQAATWYPESTLSVVVVRILTSQEVSSIVDSTGQVMERTKHVDSQLEFQVRWVGTGWRVAEIRQVVSK